MVCLNRFEDPLLILEDLSVGYVEELISEMNFEINSGEIIAIVGPSGVGKTTLTKKLASYMSINLT